jgi:hypothetical protein
MIQGTASAHAAAILLPEAFPACHVSFSSTFTFQFELRHRLFRSYSEDLFTPECRNEWFEWDDTLEIALGGSLKELKRA